MDLSGSLVCNADVLTLALNNLKLVSKLPKGDRGAPGRDGMNIKGDTGVQGLPGLPGLPGRDSTIVGPKGDEGRQGGVGPAPGLRIGTVLHGDTASVILSKDSDLMYSLNFVLPKGQEGRQGIGGRDGKHGNHEYIDTNSFGNNPRYTSQMLAKYFFADGVLPLPELSDSDCGSWFHVKTLTVLAVSGLVEGSVTLEKNESAKFVAVPYNGKILFSRF